MPMPPDSAEVGARPSSIASPSRMYLQDRNVPITFWDARWLTQVCPADCRPGRPQPADVTFTIYMSGHSPAQSGTACVGATVHRPTLSRPLFESPQIPHRASRSRCRNRNDAHSALFPEPASKGALRETLVHVGSPR